MTDRDDLVVDRYTDAYGREAIVPAAVRRAVVRTMEPLPPRGPGEPEPVAIHAPGDRLSAAAELVLEDGTSVGTVDRLPRDLPLGYHHLLRDRADQLLLVPPARCTAPARTRGWAWTAQLPATRSRASWGIGDLGDLGMLVAWAAEVGARSVVVSPLGAPNPAPDPEPSPYYPSTRRFRNPLLLRIEAIPGAGERGPEDRRPGGRGASPQRCAPHRPGTRRRPEARGAAEDLGGHRCRPSG